MTLGIATPLPLSRRCGHPTKRAGHVPWFERVSPGVLLFWVVRRALRRFDAPLLLLLSLGAAMTGGCTATKVRVANETTIDQVVALSRPFSGANYRLGAGDLITVRCYYNPQLDDEQTIRPDGVVSLSLLGELRAAGKTAAELSTEITQGYSQFFTKPNSVVVVRQFNNYRIFTAGELKSPGAFSLLTGARTVLESISVAGGITDDADLQQVVLIRRLPNQSAPMVTELDLKGALSGSDPTQNVVLMPGDMVYVPKSGMADFNLFMKQFLLNNLNASTFVGVNPPIPRGR